MDDKPLPCPRVFDLTISGAGISGLIAGIRGQQRGLKTIVLEKQKKFVDLLRGEYLQPAGLNSLKEVGLFNEVEKKGLPIFSVDHHFWPLNPFKGTQIIDFPYSEKGDFPDHAIAIAHLELKNILLKKYLQSGGRILMNATVESLENGLGNEVTIHFLNSDRRDKLVSSHLAISEGVLSTLAKKISVDWSSDPLPASFMVGGVFSNDQIPLGKFITSESREGLICAFRLTENRSRVYYYRDLPSRLNPFKQKKPLDFLKQAVKTCAISSLFENASLDERVLAAPYIPRYARRPSRGAVTLMGDAAGASHPLGGMGMSTATADGIRLADLIYDYKEGRLTLSELNSKFNDQRMEKYLNNKFISECLSYIIGGMNIQNKAIRRMALKIWSENREARDFCGKLFGGTLPAPLDLSGLFNIWGMKKDLSFLPWGKSIAKIHYGLKEFSPTAVFSDMIK